ncbi:reticulon-2b [Mugil cephalus]|uniref:reticulon-2b n=1 Tax=Mugil cephalus TaxID=48193 RepID=UPI001FB69C24|nr:reticulon-2b [Mugil cephalus]
MDLSFSIIGCIQYRIKLGQASLILLTELGWPKKAWSASQHWRRKEERGASRIAAEMATKLVDLVYWRSMRRTCVVFTGLVVGLASLFQLSAITVLSHVCLGIMCITFPLRLYYKLLELLRWNPGVHPFQSYLDHDSSLTDKETVMLVEEVVLLIAFAVTEIKRLIFIDSMIDSIKFVVLLYLLSYVGILTNGLTLVITAVIAIFSFPLLYKKQQVRIRRTMRTIRTFVKKIKNMCFGLYESVRPSDAAADAPSPKPALAAAAAAKQKAKSK